MHSNIKRGVKMNETYLVSIKDEDKISYGIRKIGDSNYYREYKVKETMFENLVKEFPKLKKEIEIIFYKLGLNLSFPNPEQNIRRSGKTTKFNIRLIIYMFLLNKISSYDFFMDGAINYDRAKRRLDTFVKMLYRLYPVEVIDKSFKKLRHSHQIHIIKEFPNITINSPMQEGLPFSNECECITYIEVEENVLNLNKENERVKTMLIQTLQIIFEKMNNITKGNYTLKINYKDRTINIYKGKIFKKNVCSMTFNDFLLEFLNKDYMYQKYITIDCIKPLIKNFYTKLMGEEM